VQIKDGSRRIPGSVTSRRGSVGSRYGGEYRSGGTKPKRLEMEPRGILWSPFRFRILKLNQNWYQNDFRVSVTVYDVNCMLGRIVIFLGVKIVILFILGAKRKIRGNWCFYARFTRYDLSCAICVRQVVCSQTDRARSKTCFRISYDWM